MLRPRMCRRRCRSWGLYVPAISWLRLPRTLPLRLRTAVVAAAKGVKTLHANNYREAADALLNRIEPGDALLVKASRGMALEKVLEIFYNEQK